MLQVVSKIREYQKDNNLSGEQLRLEIIDKKFVKLIGDDKKAYDLLLQVSKSDKEYIDLLCDMIPQFKGKRDAFSDSRPGGYNALVDGLIKVLNMCESKEKDEHREEQLRKGAYRLELKRRGYVEITDADIVGTDSGFRSVFLGLLRKVYTEVPDTLLGAKDEGLLTVKGVLNKLNYPIKKADYWSAETQSLDEDLKMRLFLKEDDISYRILLKLPLGMDNFSLIDKKTGSVCKELKNIPILLDKKDTQCSYAKPPRRLAMASDEIGLDCNYFCLDFLVSKGLTAFKESKWGLREYVQQARGTKTDTPYCQFRSLPLGKEIAFGVYPGGLQTMQFLCDGNVSGILLQGKAGSGKTAMYDSIFIQSLAMDNGDYGKGAGVIIDGKGIWDKVWLNIFNKKGIPFYGFGIEALNPDGLKIEKKNKTTGEVTVVDIPFEVYGCIAGGIFLEGIFATILELMDKAGKKTGKSISNIKNFNKANTNIDGITKIPTTALMVDELNAMQIACKSNEMKAAFNDVMFKALLTRVGGFVWYLAGQNLKKETVPSKHRGNYPYKISGGMDMEDYEYHNIVLNPAVVEYEKLYPRADKTPSYMRQGMFYVGMQGDTDLVKSLYCPEEELSDCLDDLGIDFEGLYQFDALVKYALKHGIFDKSNKGMSGLKNNIVYASLKEMGRITQEEFEYYTKRCFGEVEDENTINIKEDISVEELGDCSDDVSVEDIEGNSSVVSDTINKSMLNRPLPNSELIEDTNDDVDDYYKNREKMYDDYVDNSEEDLDGSVEADNEDVGNSSLGSKVIQFPNKGVTEDYQEEGNLAPQSDYEDDVEVSDVEVVEDIPAETNIEQSNPNPSNVIQGGWESPKSIEDIPKNDPVYTEPVKSPNTFMGCQVYEEELDLGTFNPFDARSSKTIFGGIDAFRYMNKVVEKEIKKAYHGLDRINTIHVSDNGLFINDIAFRPFVPKVVVDSLPIDIRGEVARGNIIEFFDFQMLFRLPNLDTLVIDNVRLAETKVRRELRMKRDMTWDLLYDNFDSLRLLEIGGSRITTPEEATKYTDTSGGDYEFQEKIREAFRVDSDILDRVKSPVQKLWRSRPVAIVTGALGGTVGTKVVLGMASMMGAWGILFAGLAGYGAYNTYIKGNGRNSSRGYSGSSYESYDYDDYAESKPQKSNKKSNRRR